MNFLLFVIIAHFQTVFQVFFVNRAAPKNRLAVLCKVWYHNDKRKQEHETMKITIRPATPADAQRCAEIHIRSWDAAYTGRIPQECIERARARRPSLWSTIIPTANNQSHYVIADGDTGEIAGFFVIEPARDADLPASVLELTSLYLDPAFLRRGLGRAAVQWIRTAAAERYFDTVSTWVLIGNAEAQAFYRACGFSPDGAVKPSGLGDTTVERLLLTVGC